MNLDIFNDFHLIYSKVPAYLNVVDIAGLVKGAAEGQGLGNAFLSHIAACDAIFHLCRMSWFSEFCELSKTKLLTIFNIFEYRSLRWSRCDSCRRWSWSSSRFGYYFRRAAFERRRESGENFGKNGSNSYSSQWQEIEAGICKWLMNFQLLVYNKLINEIFNRRTPWSKWEEWFRKRRSIFDLLIGVLSM